MTTDQAAPGRVPLSGASAVRPRGDGVFDADASPEWTIGGQPNGGYLLTIMARAAAAITAPAHVVACSAHFLRSPKPGPVEVGTELLRQGRSVSQVRVRLGQGDRPCVEALITTRSALTADPVTRFDGGVPVLETVPFADGFRLEPVAPDGLRVPMLDQVDMRLDPDSTGFIRGAERPRRISGWVELLGDEGFDPVSLLYAVDAFPPATVDTTVPSWAPTVELTAYVRALPAPGPVRVLSRARLVSPEWVDETCDVWDSTGRLVAQATQLAKVPGA